MFTNITVTLFVPINASMIGTKFDLEETLDDEPEKLEMLQYFVRNLGFKARFFLTFLGYSVRFQTTQQLKLFCSSLLITSTLSFKTRAVLCI